MLLIIKKGQLMVITKQNPKGGPMLKSYTIQEDEETGVYGYPLGYCDCGQRLLIRTLDMRDICNRFGWSLTEYEEAKKRLQPKPPFRHRIIKFLGGKIE